MPPPSKPGRPRKQKPSPGETRGKKKAHSSASNSESPKPQAQGMIRLQRVLANAGSGSRRACEELILAGRVEVDGEVVTTLGVRVHPQKQEVRLDGKRLQQEKKVYYAVNKPQGYLCTNSDPAGRKRVVDLIPGSSERLFTVGRLDEGSQGLIVVTNDGLLAQRLAHPSFQVRKVYRVLVAGFPTREALQSLKTGHHFEEGLFRVESVQEIKPVGQATLLEIILNEGRNREIRRLLARIGHKVMRLQRVELGPLRLGQLKLGAFRPLTRDEVQRLRKADASQSETNSSTPKPRSPQKRSAPRKRGSGPRRK